MKHPWLGIVDYCDFQHGPPNQWLQTRKEICKLDILGGVNLTSPYSNSYNSCIKRVYGLECPLTIFNKNWKAFFPTIQMSLTLHTTTWVIKSILLEKIPLLQKREGNQLLKINVLTPHYMWFQRHCFPLTQHYFPQQTLLDNCFFFFFSVTLLPLQAKPRTEKKINNLERCQVKKTSKGMLYHLIID